MRPNYVLGFMFSEDRRKVALVSKRRPDWQKGKLNGIGGRIEEGESHFDAMKREFREETGCEHGVWTQFAVITGGEEDDWGDVIVFHAIGDLTKLATTTDEKIMIIPANHLSKWSVVDSVEWLIPMALHDMRKGGSFMANIQF